MKRPRVEPTRPELVRSVARTTNADGNWVPAIPTPMFRLGRVECDCGRRFRGPDPLEAYRGHFALAHILRLEAE